MKTVKIVSYLVLFVLFVACNSDDGGENTGEKPTADFSFTNDGSTFTFTNLSQGGSAYRWDFGDLSFTSDKENPIYTYQIGGELTVSLTVTNEAGQESFIAKKIQAPEIIIIDIKIDGDFTEWDDVTEYAYESENTDGTIQRMKFWDGGEKLNFYFEGNADMNLEIVDMFFNTDGDTQTGFLHWNWLDGSSGADYLFEGPFVANGWGSFLEHNEPDGGWGWTDIGLGSKFLPSEIITDGDIKKVEFSIEKSVFTSLGEKLGFAVTDLNSGWATVGSFPDEGTAFIEVELK